MALGLIVVGLVGGWYTDVLTSCYVHGAFGMMFGICPVLPYAAPRGRSARPVIDATPREERLQRTV
jgi:hypothetical protein